MKKTKDAKIVIDRGWKTLGFGNDLIRSKPGEPKGKYIGGADFDAQLDEMMFNRMIQFKGLSKQPQGNNPGKIYFDKRDKKLKMWVDEIGKWVEVIYTSTSTSTTSSSTSTTSTSTTSSSTSTTSTSTS